MKAQKHPWTIDQKSNRWFQKIFWFIKFQSVRWKRSSVEPPMTEATVMLMVGGEIEHTAGVGNGPVNALDNALRKALEKFYPNLKIWNW